MHCLLPRPKARGFQCLMKSSRRLHLISLKPDVVRMARDPLSREMFSNRGLRTPPLPSLFHILFRSDGRSRQDVASRTDGTSRQDVASRIDVIFMYAYLLAYMRICWHKSIYGNIYAYMLAYTHTCEHICIFVSIYAYMLAQIHTWQHICIHAGIYAYMRAYMHIC